MEKNGTINVTSLPLHLQGKDLRYWYWFTLFFYVFFLSFWSFSFWNLCEKDYVFPFDLVIYGWLLKKEYAGHMVECTKEMLQTLKNAYESGNREIEISECMTRLAADIISRTEFGTSYEKGKQLFDLLTKLQAHSAQASRHLWFPGSR